MKRKRPEPSDQQSDWLRDLLAEAEQDYQEALAERERLPCGHPKSAAVYGREGTAWCRLCEAEAGGG